MMRLVLMLVLMLMLVDVPDSASSGADVVEGDGICQCAEPKPTKRRRKCNKIRISKLCFAI